MRTVSLTSLKMSPTHFAIISTIMIGKPKLMLPVASMRITVRLMVIRTTPPGRMLLVKIHWFTHTHTHTQSYCVCVCVCACVCVCVQMRHTCTHINTLELVQTSCTEKTIPSCAAAPTKANLPGSTQSCWWEQVYTVSMSCFLVDTRIKILILKLLSLWHTSCSPVDERIKILILKLLSLWHRNVQLS